MSRSTLFASGCAALLIVTSPGLAQPPGGGFGRDRGGDRGGSDRGDRNRGGFSMDPDERFNQYSGGKDVIIIDQVPDERTRQRLQFMAQNAGITNGQISRDQYRKASEAIRAQFMNGTFRGFGGAPGSFGGAQPTAPGGQTSTTTVITSPAGGPPGFGRGGERTPEQLDAEAESSFRRHDRDNDGMLRADEMSSALRTMWEKYDTNKDGAIDLNEYKSYFRDRMQQRTQDGQPPQSTQPGQTPPAAPQDGLPPAPTVPTQEEEDRRPVVYRVGKLPKELPAWFAELDTDKDGQVGLYEWVKGGRSIDEFRDMDRNDDGLLTVEEVLGYLRNGNKQPGTDTSIASANANSGDERGRFGRFGGGPPMGGRFGGDSRGFEGRGRGPSGMRPDFGRGNRSGEDGGNYRSRFGRGPDRGNSDNTQQDTSRSDAPKDGKDRRDKRDKRDRN